MERSAAAADRLRTLLASLTPAEAPPPTPLGARPAAVLALIDPGHESLPLLLLQRHNGLRSHPGQIALPGGRPDPEDRSLAQTALREAEEELGVPPSAVEMAGLLAPVETRVSGYVIHPFVGLLRHPFPLRPNPGEVELGFWLPLLEAVPERAQVAELQLRGVAMPGFRHGDHFVWGATGNVLRQLLQRMEGG